MMHLRISAHGIPESVTQPIARTKRSAILENKPDRPASGRPLFTELVLDSGRGGLTQILRQNRNLVLRGIVAGAGKNSENLQNLH